MGAPPLGGTNASTFSDFESWLAEADIDEVSRRYGTPTPEYQEVLNEWLPILSGGDEQVEGVWYSRLTRMNYSHILQLQAAVRILRQADRLPSFRIGVVIRKSQSSRASGYFY